MEFITRIGAQSTVYDVNEIVVSTDFQNWQNENTSKVLLKAVYDAYIDFIVNPDMQQHNWIKFEIKGFSGGFSITQVPQGHEMMDLIYLQLLITLKLKSLGYIINLAEKKSDEKIGSSYIIYQKPSFRLPLINEKSDQLYGNIHTEFKWKDPDLTFFKIIVHKYNDYRFDPGRSFDELMSALFLKVEV